MLSRLRGEAVAAFFVVLASACGSSNGRVGSRVDAGRDAAGEDAARADASPNDGARSDASRSDAAPRDGASNDASDGAAPPRKIDKVDVLFVIDNSRGMRDKQAVLATGAAELVGRLANPLCVDANGAPSASQPSGPTDACPGVTAREYPPVLDMHVGAISTSIGGHGSDACPASETVSCPGGETNTSNDDRGHLLSRRDPCAGGVVTTYRDMGFLAWDAAGKLTPPGEASPSALEQSTADIVKGVGEVGCTYESSLEAWYRFLVDPNPYASIAIDSGGRAVPQGSDAVLLAQRAQFLRASSLLLVVLLTDEDDCSIKESGQFYFAAQQTIPGNPGRPFRLPRARSECETNPNDPCCRSCGQSPGTCPADPTCSTALTAAEDDFNLRCFDEKRRFGIDFLYPVDRYTAALTEPTVSDATGNTVRNPIFAPNGADTAVRDADMVYFAAWVGVPWQDVARDSTDAAKGFKDDRELAATTPVGITTWDAIVGDPAAFMSPKDPHMVPSTSPRAGTDPLTGIVLAPPTAPNGTDAINGHEYSIDNAAGTADDLQYATVFDLPASRDCSIPGTASCDCVYRANDQPLCEPNPADGGNRTLQTRAKTYPGIRPLAVVKALGARGIVGSASPPQLARPAAADYGYRPNANAVIERLRPLLLR